MPRILVSEPVRRALVERGGTYDAILRGFLGIPLKSPKPRKPKPEPRPRVPRYAIPALAQLKVGESLALKWRIDPATGRPVDGQQGPARMAQRMAHRMGWKIILNGEPRGLVVTRVS